LLSKKLDLENKLFTLNPDKKFKTVDVVLIILACGFALSSLIGISYYGNPFTDESFPLATALRFIQGQKPFIDDLSPYIGIGLLLTPIIKLSLIIHHGNNELLLFARQAFIVFVISLGIYYFFMTKKYLPTFLTVFLSLMLVVFHPFGINNFHYDTIITLTWTVLLTQLYNFVVEQKNGIGHYLFFAVLTAIVSLAYPTFAFFLMAVYFLYFYSISEKPKFLGSLFIVSSILLVVMIWMLFEHYQVKAENIKNALNFSHALFQLSTQHQSTLHKFFLVIRLLVTQYYQYLFLSFMLVAMAYRFSAYKAIFFTSLLLAFPIVK